jgi:aspartyl protease family protein
MVAGMLGLCSGIAFADSNDLRSRLERLAADGEFAVGGLERIEPETVGEEHGSISDRLSFLLQNYNHVLIQDERGGISKVLITSRKTPEDTHWTESVTAVHTVRAGSHHQVEAAIAGPNGVVRIVPLMVDTGATSLLLPASMIGELGFAETDLRPAISRTANGLARKLVGTLNSVSVGAASAANVSVSFVPDQKLCGVMVLGMSFLQRFRMTIDNERNELLLQTK